MAGQGTGRTDPDLARRPDTSAAAQRVVDATTLDRLVSTTTTGAWLALAAILAALAAAAVWSLTAVVPQQISDVGIVDSRGDAQQLVAPVDGIVQFITVDGALVSKNSPVAQVTAFDGKVSTVTAPLSGVVTGIAILNGSSVSRGTPLMVISVGPEKGIDSAVTLVSADRATLYSGNPSLQVSFTDLATGTTYSVPAQVTSISNTPTTLGEQPTAAVRRLFEDSSAGTSNQILYRIDLQLRDLQNVPAGSRTVGGQVLTIINTYARPHPIELLFSDSP